MIFVAFLQYKAVSRQGFWTGIWIFFTVGLSFGFFCSRNGIGIFSHWTEIWIFSQLDWNLDCFLQLDWDFGLFFLQLDWDLDFLVRLGFVFFYTWTRIWIFYSWTGIWIFYTIGLEFGFFFRVGLGSGFSLQDWNLDFLQMGWVFFSQLACDLVFLQLNWDLDILIVGLGFFFLCWKGVPRAPEKEDPDARELLRRADSAGPVSPTCFDV